MNIKEIVGKRELEVEFLMFFDAPEWDKNKAEELIGRKEDLGENIINVVALEFLKMLPGFYQVFYRSQDDFVLVFDNLSDKVLKGDIIDIVCDIVEFSEYQDMINDQE